MLNSCLHSQPCRVPTSTPKLHIHELACSKRLPLAGTDGARDVDPPSTQMDVSSKFRYRHSFKHVVQRGFRSYTGASDGSLDILTKRTKYLSPKVGRTLSYIKCWSKSSEGPMAIAQVCAECLHDSSPHPFNKTPKYKE